MNDPAVQDDASKTLDLLRDRGWFRAMSGVPTAGYGNGNNCMLTAANQCGLMSLQLAIVKVIREQYPDRSFGDCNAPSNMQIIYFNDHPDTTFADVERVFEKVIAS